MTLEYFVILAITTGVVSLASLGIAYRRSQDSLHPMVYLGLMLFYLYCYLPLSLVSQNPIKLQSFLSITQLEHVQLINLIGTISLSLGVLYGARKTRFYTYASNQWQISPKSRTRLRKAAIICGLIGVIGFVLSIVRRGGLIAAYGRMYGGGLSQSGYSREAILLTLPALIWFMVCQIKYKSTLKDWGIIIFLAFPLLMHAILGARRGPLAMILISVVVGWYFVRSKRPSLKRVLIGAIALGTTLLFLVSNRGEIYIGSDFEFKGTSSYATSVTDSNEFIYGGAVISNADINDSYMWGKRYLTIFFVRPIPRAIWPTKYIDSSRVLGIPNLEENLGTGREAFQSSLGWSGAVGAAPGLIADMWLEFWWFSPFILFAIGWFYGAAWRKALLRGGPWIVTYILLSSLSVYLIMQTLEAMAFRFLLMSCAAWLIWHYGKTKQHVPLYSPAIYLPTSSSKP